MTAVDGANEHLPPEDQARTYEPPDPERPASAEDTLPVGAAEPLDEARQKHDPYLALRIPEYRLYSIGWLVAVIGYHLQGTTVGWEIFQWTGSALHLGISGGVQVLPLLLIGLHAGHAVDRFDRKKIACVGAVLTACCSVALLGLSYCVRAEWLPASQAVWPMYGIIFVGGTVATFTRPARAALLPMLVPQRVFPNAVTWNASIFEVASMGGPALAGLLIAYLSPRGAYGLAALCSLAFAGLLLMIRVRRPKESNAAPSGGLLAGLRFVFRDRMMLAALTLDMVAVLLGGAVYLLPQFAKEVLGAGPVGFGWLRAAPAIGAFSMALVLAHRPPMRSAGRNLLLAVAAFGGAIILFGLSRVYWLSFVALLLTGAFDNVSVVIRHTLVQLLTPDSMRGRVSAVNTIFIGSSNELGGLRAGLWSWLMGPMLAVVLGGVGTLAATAWVAIQWPQLTRLGKLEDLKAKDEG